jgi:hypothetical protein
VVELRPADDVEAKIEDDVLVIDLGATSGVEPVETTSG